VRLFALIALISSAVPVAAQGVPRQSYSLPPKPQIEPQLDLQRNGFALPIIDYTAPDGTLKRSHGIIFGRDVGRNTVVGLGLFSSGPKPSEPTDSPFTPPKKSKKVALGLTMRF